MFGEVHPQDITPVKPDRVAQTERQTTRGLGAFFDRMPDDVLLEIMELTCRSGYGHIQHGDELRQAGASGMCRLPIVWCLLSRGFYKLATETGRLYRRILVVLSNEDSDYVENAFDVRRALELGGKDLSLTLVVDIRGYRRCLRHIRGQWRMHCLTCEPWVQPPQSCQPMLLSLQSLLEEVGPRCKSLFFPIAKLPERLLDPSPSLWPRLEEVHAYGRRIPDSSKLVESGVWKAPLLNRVYYLGLRDRTEAGLSMGDNVKWGEIEQATIAEGVEIAVSLFSGRHGIYFADAARAVLSKGTRLTRLEAVIYDQFPGVLQDMNSEGEAQEVVTWRTDDGKRFPPLVNASLRELVLDYTGASMQSGPPTFFTDLCLPNLTYLQLQCNTLSEALVGDVLGFLRDCISTLTVLDVTGVLFGHGDLVELLRNAHHLEILGLGCVDRLWPWGEAEAHEPGRIPGRQVEHDCDEKHICDRLLEAMGPENCNICPRLRSVAFVMPHSTVLGVKSFIAKRRDQIREVELRRWGAVDGYGFGELQKEIDAEFQVELVGTSFVVTNRRMPLKHEYTSLWMAEVSQAHWSKELRQVCESPAFLANQSPGGWVLPEGDGAGEWAMMPDSGWSSTSFSKEWEWQSPSGSLASLP